MIFAICLIISGVCGCVAGAMMLRVEIEIEPIARKKHIHLLEKIDELGSVTLAADAVGLTYHSAWQMIGALGRRFRVPIIKRHGHGLRDGDASITEAGRQFLEVIRSISAKVEIVSRDDLARLQLLLDDYCEVGGDLRSDY